MTRAHRPCPLHRTQATFPKVKAGGEGGGARLGRGSLTDGAEVEEQGQVSAAGQAGAGLAQLVEEGVRAGLQRGQPGDRRVLQQAGA